MTVLESDGRPPPPPPPPPAPSEGGETPGFEGDLTGCATILAPGSTGRQAPRARTRGTVAGVNAAAERKAQRKAKLEARRLVRKVAKRARRERVADVFAGPIPIDRSWGIAGTVVVLLGIGALGTWQATGSDPTVVQVDARPQAVTAQPTATSGVERSNPLATVGYPVTPDAAAMIGYSADWVEVTLSTGQKVQLGVPALEAVKFKLLAGSAKPCDAKLSKPDPTKPPEVGANGVSLFDCTPPPTVPTSTVAPR